MARLYGKDRGIFERPNGSGIWWSRVFENGKDIRTKVGSKTAALAYYRKQKAKQIEGRLFPDKKRPVPFRTIAESYLDYAKVHHRRKDLDANVKVQRWIKAFGDQDSASITPSSIEKVLGEIKNQKHKNEKQYTDATVNHYLATLKTIFNRAIRDDLFATNPAAKVKLLKLNNRIVRYLTADQENNLLGKLPERLHPIVTVALNTGCRRGELVRLKWEDVDFTAGVITINQTKAGESRRVLMNSIVWKVLDQLKELKNTPWVFCSTKGTMMDGDNLKRDFDKAVKDAKLAPFRFHDLRHTFASRLAMQGANDRTLQELLGHKTPGMVLRYAHLSPTHLWQAVEGLTKVSTGTKTGTDQKAVKEEATQPIE